MKLTVVGCSGTYASPDSPASCYLLETVDTQGKTWRYVIDMGNGSLGTLQGLVDLATIDALLISHLHADHCVDAETFSLAIRFGFGPAAPLALYGPHGTLQHLALIEGSPHHLEKLMQAYDFHPWPESGTTTIGPLSITTSLMYHPVPTFGMRISDGKSVLAYSADTGPCDALTDLARDSDLFLCETSFTHRPENMVMHLSGTQAGQAATAANAAQLLLTHIPPYEDSRAIYVEAQQEFNGPIQLAHSGFTVEF